MRKRLLAVAVLAACAVSAFVATAGARHAGQAAAESSEAKPLKGKIVWYMDVVDANPLIRGIAQAMNIPIMRAGGTMIRSFAFNTQSGQIDLGLQAQAFDRAIARKPAAIVYFVLDPKSPRPQAVRAQQAKIPVFAAFGKPDGFSVNAYELLNDFQQGFLSARYLARHLPRGAKVTILGGPPTPNVNTELKGAQAALKAGGMNVVGDVDQQRNLSDNAAGGQQVMQGILQRFPDVKGVFVYNDDSALGAIAAAKAAGKKILFTSRNGSQDAVDAIKKGDLLATCDIDPIAFGRTMGQAIVDQITRKKHLTNNFKLRSPDASKCLVTKQNVAKFKPWNKRIKYVKIKTG
jgi:ribose transport system substrate-binding protein